MSNFVPGNYDLRTALIFLPFEENCCRIAANACRSLGALNHSALSGLKNSKMAILT